MHSKRHQLQITGPSKRSKQGNYRLFGGSPIVQPRRLRLKKSFRFLPAPQADPILDNASTAPNLDTFVVLLKYLWHQRAEILQEEAQWARFATGFRSKISTHFVPFNFLFHPLFSAFAVAFVTYSKYPIKIPNKYRPLALKSHLQILSFLGAATQALCARLASSKSVHSCCTLAHYAKRISSAAALVRYFRTTLVFQVFVVVSVAPSACGRL